MRYYINTEESGRLGLSGVDEKVYYFIKAYGKKGVNIGVKIMAGDFIRESEATVKRAIGRLVERGLIIVSESEYTINGGKVKNYRLPLGQNEPQVKMNPRSKCTRGGFKMNQGLGQNDLGGQVKMNHGLIYNVITKSNNKEYTESIQKEKSAENFSISDLILEKWNEHYEKKFRTNFVPDFRHLSDDKNVIAEAVKTKMAEFGKNPDDVEDAGQFVLDMFDAMYEAADEWQRNHWTLHTVAIQFNQLYNTIIRRNEHSTNNNNNRVSQDYLQRKMQEAGLV